MTAATPEAHAALPPTPRKREPATEHAARDEDHAEREPDVDGERGPCGLEGCLRQGQERGDDEERPADDAGNPARIERRRGAGAEGASGAGRSASFGSTTRTGTPQRPQNLAPARST